MKRKPEFLTPLKKQDMNNRDFFLLDELRYYSAIIKAVICVPKGFVYDGTSDLLKDNADAPAALHDDCYRSPDHKIIVLEENGDRHTVYVSKSTSDRIFLEAMKVWKTPWWARWKNYLGVVIGGQSSYDSGHKRYKIVTWDGVDRRKGKR